MRQCNYPASQAQVAESIAKPLTKGKCVLFRRQTPADNGGRRYLSHRRTYIEPMKPLNCAQLLNKSLSYCFRLSKPRCSLSRSVGWRSRWRSLPVSFTSFCHLLHWPRRHQDHLLPHICLTGRRRRDPAWENGQDNRTQRAAELRLICPLGNNAKAV